VALLAPTAEASAATAVPRVVGGHAPAPGAWPFAVAVRTPFQLCTGAVIAPQRVLTAAHCIDAPARVSVRVGSRRAGSGGRLLGVAEVVMNPGFSANLPGNAFLGDLAVLKLSSPAGVPAIAMAGLGEDLSLTAPGAVFNMAGFGWRTPGAKGPVRQGILRASRLRSRKTCTRNPSFSAASMICAAGDRFTADIGGRGEKPLVRSGCFGDSGGPLVAATSAGPRLVGVLSYGPEYPPRFDPVSCGLKGFPDVYMRVASSRTFIDASL
jgi:trypsin